MNQSQSTQQQERHISQVADLKNMKITYDCLLRK